MFSRLAGNKDAKGFLKRMLVNDRVPHGLLFAGPEGVGKKEFALELAPALIFGSSSDGEGCGVCPICKRIGIFDLATTEKGEDYDRVFLSDHPDVGLVFSDYEEFGDSKTAERGHVRTCPLLSALLAKLPDESSPIVLDPVQSTELLITENFGSSSPLARRRVIEALGGYDESAIPSEDFEFQYRVAAAYKIAVLPKVGWLKRQHPSNLSSNTPRVLLCKIAIRGRILDRETVPRRRKKLRQMMAGYHSELASFYTGRENVSAVRHAMISMRLGRRLVPRMLLRILFDALGRDTHGLRRIARQAAR